MSRETFQTLNNNTLIGYTDERGHAWHYRSEDQGDEDNHYPGAIPVDDVVRRLFNFKVIEAPTAYILEGRIEGAVTTYKAGTKEFSVIMSSQERKGTLRDDTYYDMGVFKEGYQGHDYEEWLLDNWGHILDTSNDELGIGSAGLLKNGGQAWVSIERPDTITTKEGVAFRPYLLGYSSFDGSLATGYGDKVTLVVCDNTLAAAVREKGNSYRLRHTRHSMLRIGEAREALGIIFKIEETFRKEVEELTKWKVSDKTFEKFLDVLIPIPDLPDGKEKSRGHTVATKKRDDIMALYKNDERAAPWAGTAFGVLQAFNTYQHHMTQVRKGTPRIIRNMENVVSDKLADSDRNILDQLAAVA